jgi:hypothetical protein
VVGQPRSSVQFLYSFLEFYAGIIHYGTEGSYLKERDASVLLIAWCDCCYSVVVELPILLVNSHSPSIRRDCIRS